MVSLGEEISRIAALISILICASGQGAIAGEPLPPVHLFAIPAATLRPLEPQSVQTVQLSAKKESETSVLSQPPAGQSEDITVEFKPRWGISEEARAQIYEGLNGPILSQIEPEPEPAGALGWVQVNMWDPIFTLESVSIRKVHVTGSIITAIQRKNPFCLLNPLVLAVDW